MSVKATFGAGCFWGVEEAFRNVRGVTSTAVGYLGGTLENPTYKDVCGGRTGHAEVVQVEFDPGVVSYRELLEIFWSNHDPTQMNRQGPDVGSQYRSAIFFHDDEQQAEANRSKAEQDGSGNHKGPVATVIEAIDSFWPAEDYHQQYLEKRGQASCRIT